MHNILSSAVLLNLLGALGTIIAAVAAYVAHKAWSLVNAVDDKIKNREIHTLVIEGEDEAVKLIKANEVVIVAAAKKIGVPDSVTKPFIDAFVAAAPKQ